MRCLNCNNEISKDMKFCPFCGKNIVLTERNNNIVKILVVIIIVSMIGFRVMQFKKEELELLDYVYKLAGDYDTVYRNDKLPDEGIFQSRSDSAVYYVKDKNTGT